MKFVSFISSTILIVLISQYSVIGLPLNDTVVEERCSEGFEKIDGHCVPISVTTSANTIEPETHQTKTLIRDEEKPILKLTPGEITGRCPEGMEHGEHGRCKEIKLSESTTIEPATHRTETLIRHQEQLVTILTPVEITGRCPEGMEHGEHGICQQTKLSESTTTAESNIESTTNVNDDKHKEVNLKDCPEGAKRDKDGICQEIKLSSTTTPIIESKTLAESTTTVEVDIKSTTDVNDDKRKEVEPSESTTTVEIDVVSTTDVNNDKRKKVKLYEGTTTTEDNIVSTTDVNDDKHKEGKLSESTATTEDDVVSTTDGNDDKHKEVNLMECPEGAKRDEDGSCEEIKPSSTTKPITDPKSLLKEDGSCPDEYKLIEGRCLYVKPKTNSTLPLKKSDNDVSRAQPRDGKQISQYELVPVLDDNSCPEGTEHAEFGLCQKRIPTCPTGSEFINGKCSPKRLPTGPKFTTSTNIPETKPTQRPIDHEELTKSTPELETVTMTIHEKTEKIIKKPVKLSRA